MLRPINFRDVASELKGAVRLRPGLLFRSGRGRTQAADFLTELGVRSIVDLRELDEIPAKDQDGAARVSHIPLIFDSSVKKKVLPLLWKRVDQAELVKIYVEAYRDMLRNLLPRWKMLLELLVADDGLPMLIHCRAGKDRTGLVAALLLKTLGVEPDDIRHDYLTSNDFFPQTVLGRIRFLQWTSLGLLRVDNLRFILYCREAYLDAVFTALDMEFGGIEQYLKKAGVDETTVARLKTLLLEPGAPAS
jgi:protein-tyrosine phosphatase